jgi:YHS domain-containing protein
MLPRVPRLALVLALSVPAAFAQALPELALAGLDPVALCKGEELAGDEAHTVDLRRYRYRFANEVNKQTFESDPERWCIQLGGGCGRMGPLSGVGDPARFAVHDGRIYIFASDGCRSGFLKHPASFLEIADPIAEGSEAERAAAHELLDLAVGALGGAERLRTLRSVAMRDEREEDYQGRKVKAGSSLLLAAPGGIRSESWWDAYHVARVSVVRAGFTAERSSADAERTVWDFDDSQALLHAKTALREPIALLAVRDRGGFVAVARGEREVDGRQARGVAVSFFGATTTLWIDVEHGRVLGASYHGRLGSSGNAHVELRFEDFREVGGFVLPFVRKARIGDKDAGTRTWTSIVVNGEVDRSLFRR